MSPPPFAPLAVPRSLVVVWQSEGLVAIDKPAGLLSQGGPGAGGANVVDLARARFGSDKVGVLHRLDRNVSGLVLVSLEHDVAEGMSRAFAEGTVERRYEAVVRLPAQRTDVTVGEERLIDVPLAKDPRTNLVRVVEPGTKDAKDARTKIRVRERIQVPLGWLAIVDAWPLTGRSHQIRAHLAHVGMPLLGDPKYGASARGVHRPLLHATELAFTHPRTGERVVVSSSPPWTAADLRGLRRAEAPTHRD